MSANNLVNGTPLTVQPLSGPMDPSPDLMQNWKQPANETDPNGFDAHTPGAKLDSGKNKLGLVLGGFARALESVGLVGSFGLLKYTANGWMVVDNGIERYTDALYRHLNAEAQGELRDKDSELLHASHAAWNALARLDLILRQQNGR